MKFLFKVMLILGYTVSLSAQEVPSKDAASKKVGDAFSKKDLKGDLKEGWNKSTQFGINFNMTGFNSSWKSVNDGAKGNTTLGFVLNHHDALLKGKNTWVNDIQGQIGFLKSEGSAFARNVDKLFLNSMYGREISDKLLVYAEANFISQFLKSEDPEATGTRNLGSAFMAPGYLTISTGLNYRPLDYLSFKISPVANKWTFVANDHIMANEDGYAYGVPIATGDEKQAKYISEFGSQITVGFNKEVVKNVNLGFRYNAFKAWKESSGVKNKPIDHRLDLVATAAINKYLNVNFTYIGIGDKDIVDGWQSASGLGVGFLVNF
ncbi:DUF3078 domain-containing protein [Marinilongibacter aquaticus]|uniref:DUF3078 domain-containing protein n=1 Tax=Marinilongibacter aquaticus TaxID=2975157 RepID=UPI0021BD08FA|nr:DUF3078 domain-containing protein [Marinilongibacter aquaticus]UBM57256.1 DUF3078 domain-containing protein [Marinilongibacter aquaticus]